jgi:CHAT domain-containing protein
LTLAGVSSHLCAVTEATIATVTSAVQLGWHVVHISAHGQSDGALLLEDGLGNAVPLGRGRDLSDLLEHASNTAQLAVLSACYSEVCLSVLSVVGRCLTLWLHDRQRPARC